MAKLTDQLDTVNSGKRLVAPAENGPSFLGGLAKLSSGAMNAFEQNSNSERQNKVFEQNQTDRAATNALETQFMDAKRTAANFARQDPGIDPSLGDNSTNDAYVPQAAIDAERELSRTKRGVSQGRVAQEQMQLQMEKVWTDLEHQYPDSVGEMAQYMQSRGHEHYLFRDLALQDSMSKADEQGISLGRAQAVETATKNGLALPGMTPEQVYQRGADFLHAQAMADIAQKQAQAAKEAKASSQGDFKFQEGVDDRRALAATNAMAGTYLGATMDVVSNLANSASTDAQYKQLAGKQDEINSGMDVFASHIEQRIWASNGTQEMVNAFRQGVEIKKKAVNDIFFGPASRFSQTHRSFAEMQDKLSLSVVDALPVYSMAVRLIGQGGVTQLFAGDPNLGLSPEFTKKLTAELKAYDPTHPNEAINMLYQVGEIIKGNAKLQDIPESKITPDYMRTLNAATVGTAKRIKDPEADNPEDYNQFRNSLGALSIAAIRIQPGNKDIKAMDWAIGAIANNQTASVLDKMTKDPLYKDDAKPLMMETRAAAAQILEAARTGVDPVLGQKLVWRNGHYEIDIKQAKGGGDSIMLPDGSSYQPIGGNMMSASPNPNLTHQANTMNAAVNYLVNTAPHDESIPKGVTPLMLREHYATGRALPKPKVAEGDKGAAWENSFNLLDETLGKMNSDIQNKIPFKNPQTGDLFGALIQQESGGRAGVTGPDTPYGNAQGMTQMLPATAKSMATKLGIAWHPELMTDTTEKGAEYQKLLGKAYLDEGLAKYDGDTRKALMYYHGGPDEKLWGPKTHQYAESILSKLEG